MSDAAEIFIAKICDNRVFYSFLLLIPVATVILSYFKKKILGYIPSFCLGAVVLGFIFIIFFDERLFPQEPFYPEIYDAPGTRIFDWSVFVLVVSLILRRLTRYAAEQTRSHVPSSYSSSQACSVNEYLKRKTKLEKLEQKKKLAEGSQKNSSH